MIVAEPARLPWMTPSAETATYFALLVENFRVPRVPSGSIRVVSWSFSLRPMEVRAAVSVTPVGAGTTVRAQVSVTPL